MNTSYFSNIKKDPSIFPTRGVRRQGVAIYSMF
jgi:hypothetical protein